MCTSIHILCMNDCTLPIHLNSILHITSTLIWAIKCAVCLCNSFQLRLPSTGTPIDPWSSSMLRQWLNGFFRWKNFPKRWSAFCDDCNRGKCFTTHFRSFVSINKVALNCICLYLKLFKGVDDTDSRFKYISWITNSYYLEPWDCILKDVFLFNSFMSFFNAAPSGTISAHIGYIPVELIEKICIILLRLYPAVRTIDCKKKKKKVYSFCQLIRNSYMEVHALHLDNIGLVKHCLFWQVLFSAATFRWKLRIWRQYFLKLTHPSCLVATVPAAWDYNG